jgi:hypothetical protein
VLHPGDASGRTSSHKPHATAITPTGGKPPWLREN